MRRASLVLALVCAPAASWGSGDVCGGFEKRGLQKKPFPLLGGRLTIRALDGAELKDRQGSIMGADPNAQTESRVWLQAKGGKKLVILVRELFRKPTKDLAAAVQARAPAGAKVEPFAAVGLSGVTIVPSTFEPVGEDRDAIRVLGVLVAAPDGTLQTVDFYVSPEVAADVSGCVAVARRVGQTLAAGERKLDLAGGRKDLGDGISLTLPEGHALTVDHGPDFDVYRVSSLLPYGSRATFGVYLGHHAHMESSPTSRKVPARIFGNAVALEEQQQEGLTVRQQVIPVPGKGGLVAHVFFSADDAATLASLQRLAETLDAK